MTLQALDFQYRQPPPITGIRDLMGYSPGVEEAPESRPSYTRAFLRGVGQLEAVAALTSRTDGFQPSAAIEFFKPGRWWGRLESALKTALGSRALKDRALHGKGEPGISR